MKASDWELSELEWRTLCSDAVSLAKDERSQDFAHDMALNAHNHSLEAFVSEKQMSWLCRIADWEPPKKRTQPC